MKFLIVLSIVASVLSDENSETILRRSNDKFTSQMFSEVVKSHPGESVVLSAFSVLSPVAQLALASVGESHDEALQLLGFSDDNVTKAVFQENNKKLRNVEGVELKIANCIYIRTGAELNDNFAAVSRDTFGSEVKNADFTQNVATAKEINTWVEEHTNNRIKDLVNPDSLDGDTAAVLVNAIYFKGTWKNVFDERFTSDRDFHVTKDKTIQVPMMYQTDEYKYGESKELDAKLLELPYIGDQSSLLIVLPNEIDGITSLEEKLKNTQLLENAVQQMSVYDVDVSLPKFKIETTTNLKEVLMTLGVKKLFSPGEARLDNLIKGASDLYISEAIQKAFIEVNEKGSEAAAANQFIAVYRSAKLYFNTKQFLANRPFYWSLQQEGLSLFNGVFHF